MTKGDVILITGTSSGFGRLLAETCARQGYTVYASMRHATGRNAAAREALQTLAATTGLSLHVLELDVTDEASVEHAVQEIITHSGRIDVLINNAGFGYIGLNEACTLADLQHQFDTNFFEVARMNRAVLPSHAPTGAWLGHLHEFCRRANYSPLLGALHCEQVRPGSTCRVLPLSTLQLGN
jgi:NAD(P)-dependent dehydrogenase (short-subunit alcohol dehydrogenase family)